MNYTPYGEVIKSKSTGTDLFNKKYTGQTYDASSSMKDGEEDTGLCYYNARYYDPGIGRFISADSVVPNPYNSQAYNRYMYVVGNPIRYNDPSGHVPDGPGSTDTDQSEPDPGAGGTIGPAAPGADYGERTVCISNGKYCWKQPRPEKFVQGLDNNNKKIETIATENPNVESVVLAEDNGIETPISVHDYRGKTDEPGVFQKFRNRTHTGIDYKAKVGTSIYSVITGNVIFAGEQAGYGNLIIIEDENGYRYLFAHLSEIFVEIGQTVVKKEIIGLSGKTGHVTGPHLHFEIQDKNQNALNPYTGEVIDIYHRNIFNLNPVEIHMILPYRIRKK